MMFKRLRLLKEEKGNALIIIAFMFAFFMGVTGIVIDLGIVYKTKSELRKTANAAVFSGAQELLNPDSNVVNQVVQNILNANNEASTLKDIKVKPEGQNKVTVTLEKRVPFYFMKFFGMGSTVIDVDATAGIFPMKIADRVAPLGIDKSTLDNLQVGQDITLKVGAGDSTYGNFGILALQGVGAKLYEDAMMYGSEVPVTADPNNPQVVLTQTGNVAGNTRKAIDYRIANSKYPLGDTSHIDDTRRICIMVYEPNEADGNQVKSVRVVGLALFYITNVSGNNNDATITCRKITGVWSGTGSETQQDTGAYAVKLLLN